MAVLVLVALAAAAVLLAREFWQWYRLSHVPGPCSHAITGFAMARAALNGAVHEYYMDLHERYGPLVRIGPNTVMFSDAETLKRIAAARSGYTKGEWYVVGRTTPGEDHLFSLRDEDKRRHLKSRMGPGYSGLENGGFEAGVDKHVASFVDLIESKYVSTAAEYRPMDMASKSTYFALDVVSELGFGHAYGFLREDRDLYQYVGTKDAFFPVMVTMGSVPWLARLMHSWPLSLGLPRSADSAGFGALMGFAKTFVDGRLAPDAKPGRDMMQSFINAGLTREELTQEVYVETIAGSDTTATAIRMILLSLLSNPQAYSSLRAEIDAAAAANRISRPVRDAEARTLPYLQAVIREGLRLYPPSTGIVSKEVPAGGDAVHGFRLPAGTQLGENVCGIGRARDVFGPDAHVFRPERWIEAARGGDERRFREMLSTADLVFGYGKFYCMGRSIALIELNKIFVELFRRYDLAIAKPERPMKLWSAGFWITHDFWLSVSRRDGQ
ncbi:Cytochrome P450 monooxygenase lolP1 [Colletotrichum orbiculare MAFF 240422]|uniref:Cytochrome P450 monooxygenase lolP1 n=1 Tax=Colletotrichum orbiculare (strain 104-T / ATCC 96160 / CBS 514.97 / LARS 414 / MAFF 240422) TaxID=1213857 RepID=N4VF74_COLOR|nr:Cytochrome P450 monooxygenase lolP1 [Colletotrichum orbiculare MAFF 240422]